MLEWLKFKADEINDIVEGLYSDLVDLVSGLVLPIADGLSVVLEAILSTIMLILYPLWVVPYKIYKRRRSRR